MERLSFLQNRTRGGLGLAIVALLASTLLGACPSQRHENADSGVEDDGSVSSAIALAFEVSDGDNGGWVLSEARVTAESLRIQSDLGSGIDPLFSGLGVLTLRPGSSFVMGEALPATFSQIQVGLATSGSDPAWSLQLVRSGGQTLSIHSAHSLSIVTRCTSPVSNQAGDQLALTWILEGQGLVSIVDSAGIPPGAGNTILDETTSPMLVTAIETYFASGFTLECELD